MFDEWLCLFLNLETHGVAEKYRALEAAE